ncbi:zinc finger protein 41-like [Aricia agestis]|uniref:zinc finger protein 41-like n=1 Tax=Aricia agestis TaxID=91739 RepID=UPI001C205ADE|nr:zinc finger protein 41-like [Aricia agestis]
MEEICRLCCSTKFVNNHIFDEENALFIKMSLYLPIKLHKGDQLPQRVCDKCSCKVNDFYQFCNEAIEAQNRLKIIYAYESKQPVESIDLTIIKKDPSSPPLHCDKSTQTAEEKSNLSLPSIKEEPKQHSLSIVKQELSDDDFLPDLNSDSSNSEDEVLSKIKHNKHLHNPKNKSLANGIASNVKKTNKIPTNDWTKGFAGKLLAENNVNLLQSDGQVNLNVVKHELYEVKPQDLGLDFNVLDDISQNVFYCCICFIQMENKIDMLNHYKVHVSKAELQMEPPPAPPLPDEPPFRCTRCKKIVDKGSTWAAHWKRHWARDNRPYRCTLCEKTFRDHKQIFKHGLTHKAGERTSAVQNRYVCDTCPESFVYMKCLLAHRTRAHPEAATRPLQLRCTVCARVFAHINSLRRHQRSHTGERNHLCNVCGKALSSREHLKFHIRIHTGYKPNVCGVCGKGFVKKCNLTLHERVHSGEKPHVCSHCGKAFSQRSTLVIHERYHSGARPYVCSVCGRGFVAKGLLSMHLKTACVDHPPPIDKMSSRS